MPSAQPSTYRPAAPDDAATLLALQQAFYAQEGYPFDADAIGPAWAALLSTPSLGHAWLAEDQGRAVAYVVVTIGFSLEHLGRDAFIDELFVVSSHRGRGLGQGGLEVATSWCRRQGIRVILLEVEGDNDVAQHLYARSGFAGDRRRLLKRHL